MAGITPLNHFLGPESDPVTADSPLPKYQSTKAVDLEIAPPWVGLSNKQTHTPWGPATLLPRERTYTLRQSSTREQKKDTGNMEIEATHTAYLHM